MFVREWFWHDDDNNAYQPGMHGECRLDTEYNPTKQCSTEYTYIQALITDYIVDHLGDVLLFSILESIENS